MASKRPLDLVDYASSDDEVEPIQDKEPAMKEPTRKKRKLPLLSAGLTLPQPVDDPRLHQGRVRSVPYVEGQWAAYVYVPVRLSSRSPLLKLIRESLVTARDVVPTLRSLVDVGGDRNEVELHISLSRPVFLRTHQREDFKRCVKALGGSQKPFAVSFANFGTLDNDERTRGFLALEVGAGHNNLKLLSDGLEPTLRSLRQQAYYESPRFHASVAWALLGPSRESERDPRVSSDDTPQINSTPLPELLDATRSGHDDSLDFPTVPALPAELLARITSVYSTRLTSPTIGTFMADTISVQIGKDISTWSFTGTGT